MAAEQVAGAAGVGAASASPAAHARHVPRNNLRPEIQGLRALAVAAVLVFPLAPGRFPGGYVGVDIFFVISGYLITGHLPAALLTLTAVAVATIAVVPKVLWGQYLGETMAATLYVQNWRLAATSVDYFAAANSPSPVQHFWTLSAEEQFYVALPLLVLLGVLVQRRTKVSSRAVLLVLLGVVVVASLVVSVLQTRSNPSVAYFSSAARAWEFAAGGLLAFAPTAGRFAGSLRVRAGVAVVGCLALAATFATFDEATAFPGYAAMLPVVGTAAVIWAGTLPWRWAPSAVGAWPPVATVGRVSYSIYLWHWPLIVLLPMVTGVRLRLVDMAAITAATLLLALATAAWVEDPVRFSPRLLGGGRRPRTVAWWSLAGMVVVLAVAGAGLTVSRSALDAARAARDRAWRADVACLGASALGGRPESCATAGLDGVLVPHPVLAPHDRYDRADCWSSNGESELRVCSLGPAAGFERRLLALGDSHGHMFLPAYELAAHELGWRIDVAGHANCYWTKADTPDPVPAFGAACAQWRAAVDAYVSSGAPYDAIVVIAARTAELARADGDLDAAGATVRGLHEAWSTPESRGTTVVALADVPQPRRDVVECVVRHGQEATERCATPRGRASAPEDMTAVAAHAHGVAVIDLTDLMCDDESCHAVVEGAVVWQDRGHITATFARSLGPVLAERLTELLDKHGP